MLSLGELMFIKRIDFQTRKFLTIFLKCAADETKKPTVLDMLTTGKHEIAINTSTPFYTADGYKTDSKISNSSKYLGDKNRLACVITTSTTMNCNSVLQPKKTQENLSLVGGIF